MDPVPVTGLSSSYESIVENPVCFKDVLDRLSHSYLHVLTGSTIKRPDKPAGSAGSSGSSASAARKRANSGVPETRPATPTETVTMCLKDLHLIYLNCQRFNFSGSAVHKMSEVQHKFLKKLASLNFSEAAGTGAHPAALREVEDFAKAQVKERREYERAIAKWKKAGGPAKLPAKGSCYVVQSAKGQR